MTVPAPTLIIRNETETQALGAKLADALPSGSVVSLLGTLGAGKTRLVQAVAQALGVDREDVTSPTFVLVNEYTTGRLPVYHFDAYRLRDDDEFLQLGPEEYFSGEGGKAPGVTFVEWGDRVAGCLPVDCIEIEIDVTGETERTVTVRDPSGRLTQSLETESQI